MAANQPKFGVAYTPVVTIATDDHHTRQEFRASVGTEWAFLSDPGRTVAPEFIEGLRAASSETRPDWDLSKPGLHEAWAADDYASFHGWNKRPQSVPSSYQS